MSEGTGKRGLPGWMNRTNAGLLLLVLVVAASLLQVARTQEGMDPPGKVTIRIAFWQLEGGYREAMAGEIRKYEALHPEVHIIMMPVTERLYPQWLNGLLVNDMAPDLCEMGNGNAGAQLTNIDSYKGMYFRGMSDVLALPNPYNQGTPLEKVPWRVTFIDGMQGLFTESLQEYYAVPTSFFGTGIYYNAELVEGAVKEAATRAVSVPVPPQTYGQLIKLCEAVKAYGAKRKRTIAPLVACYPMQYDAFLFENLIVGFTEPLEREADVNLDGQISQEETYMAYVRGPAKPGTPRLRALFATYKSLYPEFAEGILAMDRDEATRRFVQGDAAMVITGSWDAGSLLKASQGRFTLKTMRYPVPVKGEKVLVDGKEIDFGDSPDASGVPYFAGRMNSANATGGAGYGIYKYTAHEAEALDFLRFLTSQKENGEFNKVSEWAPAVAGAAAPELGKPFLPDPEGYISRLRWDFNNELRGQFLSEVQDYLGSRITYDEFCPRMEEALRDPVHGAYQAWSQRYEDERTDVLSDERSMAAHLTVALLAEDKEGDEARDKAAADGGAAEGGAAEGEVKEERRKYNGLLLQQVRKNDGEERAFRYRQLTGKALTVR